MRASRNKERRKDKEGGERRKIQRGGKKGEMKEKKTMTIKELNKEIFMKMLFIFHYRINILGTWSEYSNIYVYLGVPKL